MNRPCLNLIFWDATSLIENSVAHLFEVYG